MLSSKVFLTIFFTTLSLLAISQQDPIFFPFTGNVYEIPLNKVYKGYGQHLREYAKIGEVNWSAINFAERHIDKPFPGVKRKKLFGIIVRSKMKISEEGCYDFSLNSDDGSSLWISGQLIIDNDSLHRMRERRDTLHLAPGTYPVKLWYYQGFPDKYGFIFKANQLAAEVECEKTLTPIAQAEKMIVNSTVLFDYGKTELKVESKAHLDSLSQIIMNLRPQKITVVGHTDNIGSAEYNLELSQKRAEAIINQIMLRINSEGIHFEAKGLGETNPIASNDSESGRTKNRRVEIILENTDDPY